VTAPRATVAFIGLGRMGLPMAVNLVGAGHEVTGFDVVPDAVTSATQQGIAVAASGAEAVADVDIVITMLPGAQHVLDCYGDPEQPGERAGEGMVAVARPGTLFVDCSTIDVTSSRSVHALADAAGHRCVDAPVSGGVVGAEAGTLTFMAGGTAAAVEAARPVLDVMGRRVVHCGEAGAGQAAKICNNMVLASTMVAVSEAFVLGEALGLDHQAFFDVAAHASGQCWALTTNCPVPGPVPTSPANRDYTPGFATGLMHKDLGLAMTAATEHGVDTTIGRTAAAVYAEFLEHDGPARDFSAIIHDIRERSAKTR
jgi:3-hydroxyisobutyrate dehydrogenase